MSDKKNPTSPKLIEEMHFEEGIYSFAASPDGRRIAVGSKGLLGLYVVKDHGQRKKLSHTASFLIPGRDHAVTHLLFSEDGETLIVSSEDGYTRTLSVEEKSGGMLLELSRSPTTVVESDLRFEAE